MFQAAKRAFLRPNFASYLPTRPRVRRCACVVPTHPHFVISQHVGRSISRLSNPSNGLDSTLGPALRVQWSPFLLPSHSARCCIRTPFKGRRRTTTTT